MQQIPATQNPYLMIGTPAYAGMVHMDYVGSISEYYRAGMNFSSMMIGNESLITRARNSILARFYASETHTHLLFLDGDVQLSADGLKRLLSHQEDVIAAAVPLKSLNERGERIFNFGNALGEKGALVEVTRVGTAALLLSKKAVNALVEDAKANHRVYSRPTHVRGSPLPETHFDVFRVGVVAGDYLSEDFYACYTLRHLGFKVYIDPQVLTRHQGVTEF
jgi:hypothetical protein